MQTTGTRRIFATPADIHRLLDSAALLRQCMPLCDTFTGSIAEGYTFALTTRLGPLRMTFQGRASFAQADQRSGYVLDVTATSRLSGQISTRISLALTRRPRATLVDFAASMEPSGVAKIVGADRMAGHFSKGIEAFADRLKAAAEAQSTLPARVRT